MKRVKNRNNQTPLDQLFDDPDEIPSYHLRDDDAERRIAKMERNLESDNDLRDVGWENYKTF
jgi:hypothetical protein